MPRVVVVNHSHPSMPHVSGMRAWQFARELATRGHQVVLLCEWREGVPPAPDADGLDEQLRGHDWNAPFVIAVKPTPVPLLTRVRSTETGSLLRKLLVVRSYVTKSGMFTDFSDGAQPYLVSLARAFKPQAVWGTFGNTDCWLIAQRLARLSGCGWVGDMKDAWDRWIPSGLRTLVARRFQDMAASTANAEFNAVVLARWFRPRPVVVYSGVDSEWIRSSSMRATERAGPEAFRVMLVGGLYDQQNIVRFLSGFEAWVQSVPPSDRPRISLCYAGSDAERMTPAVTGLSRNIRVDIRGYLPLSELASLCRGAAVNVYLWSPTGFHHKLVELLCCRRPIVTFPGERAESLALARQSGGSLKVCSNEGDLRAAFDAIWNGSLQPAGDAEQLQHLTWTAQADTLDGVLRRVAESTA
jgi:hypothetical protein